MKEVCNVFHRSSRGSPERGRDEAKRLHKTVVQRGPCIKGPADLVLREQTNWATSNKYTETSTYRAFAHVNHFSDKNNGLDDNGEPLRK